MKYLRFLSTDVYFLAECPSFDRKRKNYASFDFCRKFETKIWFVKWSLRFKLRSFSLQTSLSKQFISKAIKNLFTNNIKVRYFTNFLIRSLSPETGNIRSCYMFFIVNRSPFQKNWRVPCFSLFFLIGTSFHLPKVP